MASIKKNVFYNYLWTLSIILYPIITFPYASRVLGPEGIGITSYTIAFTKYFILFGALGIPTYGIRAIAQSRGNQESLNSTFSELSIIQFTATAVTAIIFFVISSYIEPFDTDSSLQILSFIYIFSNFGIIDWFYKGIENYKIVTIRTLINKVISILFIFIFVNDASDYWIYFGIFTLSSVIDCFINFFPLRNYLTSFSIKLSGLKKHATPILFLFSTQLAISIYVNLDTVMLGFLSSDKEVGYYTASIKLVKLSLTGIGALGAVLIPRLSVLLLEKKGEEFNRLLNKSITFVGMFGFPMAAGLIILAEPIIYIFAGPDFNQSVLVAQVLAPLVIIIGLSNIFGMQVLVPGGKEKYLLLAVLGGSVINVALNFLLIPNYGALGASYATICAEVVVTAFTFLFACKNFTFSVPGRSLLKYLSISLLFFPATYVLKEAVTSFNTFLTQVILVIMLCAGIYFLFLYLLKDKLLTESLNQIKRKIL